MSILSGRLMERAAGVVGAGLVIATLLLAGGCSPEPRTIISDDVEYLPSEAMRRRARGPAVLTVLEPVAGTTVTSPFEIQVAVENYVMAPRGRSLDGEGHLHVIVDGPCIDPGQVIPNDATHLHVPNGRSKLLMELEPGPHELCLQVGDGFHNALAIVDRLSVEVR